ncbi:hypothetical protein ACFX13_041189 [Malus domestica]
MAEISRRMRGSIAASAWDLSMILMATAVLSMRDWTEEDRAAVTEILPSPLQLKLLKTFLVSSATKLHSSMRAGGGTVVAATLHVPSKPPGNRPEARPQGSPEVCSGDRRSEEASPLQAGNGGAERDQEVPEEHGAPDPQAAIPKAGEGENANWASWAWRSFNGSDFRASTVLLVDPNPPNEPESKPESPRSEESVREVKTKESEKTKTTATATAMAMAIL